MVYKNARIITMCGEPIECGCLRVENGKFAEIARDIHDENAVDLGGATIVPGYVDAHCHVGMWEDGMDFEGADGNESTDPVTPEMRAIDGVNPFDPCFAEARNAGITTVVTGPGSSNVIGGQFVALKTCEGSVDDKLLRFPQSLKTAFGENPKTVYNEQKKAPMTRMAVASLIRESFIEAGEYGEELAKAKNDPDKDFERDLQKEILLEALKGNLMVKAHAHRADDILTVLRLAREFNLKVSIDHCTEGHLITRYLKDSGAKIILGPLLCERSKIELKNLTMKAPRLMYEAGIEFAIMTDHPVIPIQYLPVCAALAAREGLPDMEALKAITINAARAAGIDDRVGSIEPGKDADFTVFAGDPIDIRSKILLLAINGEIAVDNR